MTTRINHEGVKLTDCITVSPPSARFRGIARCFALGVLVLLIATLHTTSAHADSPYNYSIPASNPSHLAQYIGSKNNAVQVPLRDTHGLQLTWSDGAPAYLTARHDSRCPGTNRCLQVQGYGPSITTEYGKTLYYVWEWQAHTADGDLPGLVAQSDLASTPSLSPTGANGNGNAAEFIFSAGHPVYTVTPTPIPWDFGYRGATDNLSHQFAPYGQYGSAVRRPNYALLSWNWIDVGGGGIGQASVRAGEPFYPATNVAPIESPVFAYAGTGQPLGTTRIGTVTARYGAVWNGVRQVWGWMVMSHSYEGGGCVNHVAYSSGTALPNTTCPPNPPQLYQPPDTVTPSAPSNVTASIGGTTANLAWTASTDNVGILRYDVYNAGVFLGSTTTPSYSVTNLSCSTPYTFQIVAGDAAGNTATTSYALSTNSCLPTVTITSPTQNQVFNTTSASLTYTTTGAPTSVTCALDTAAPAPCPSPVSATGLGEGPHTVVVTATNSYGSSTATVTFSIDAAPLDTSVTGGPADGSTITSARPTFGFNSNKLNVTFVCWMENSPQVPCTSPYEAPLQSNGTHTFYVAAKNSSGVIDSTPASRSFTQNVADTTPPSAPTATVTGITKTGATVQWTAATDNTGVTNYMIYSNNAWVVTLPVSPLTYNLTGLTCNTHYDINVVPLDVANNYSISSTLGINTLAC